MSAHPVDDGADGLLARLLDGAQAPTDADLGRLRDEPELLRRLVRHRAMADGLGRRHQRGRPGGDHRAGRRPAVALPGPARQRRHPQCRAGCGHASALARPLAVETRQRLCPAAGAVLILGFAWQAEIEVSELRVDVAVP